jgi:hypothetical protein
LGISEVVESVADNFSFLCIVEQSGVFGFEGGSDDLWDEGAGT